VIGAKKALRVLSNAGPNDLVIILISGGGSALLASPRISLDDLQKTTKSLLASGATIQEINTIRKHLSTVKGGQLVKSLPCGVVSFIISDVVGDPLQFIASGPTVGDSTTFSDAFTILEKYGLWDTVPDSVKRVISQGKTGRISETPTPDDPVFSHVSNMIVSNNSLACETVFNEAKKKGFEPVILSTHVTGEARKLSLWLIEKAKKIHEETGGTVFISGGEPTVTLSGSGKGGRNQELVLSAVPLLKDSKSVFASFGTDGIDGMSPAAGAIADGNSFIRATGKEMDVETYLKNNDSFTFFHQLNDVLITGPTGTNVMDVQVLIL
jgi:glycerate-2-kinase